MAVSGWSSPPNPGRGCPGLCDRVSPPPRIGHVLAADTPGYCTWWRPSPLQWPGEWTEHIGPVSCRSWWRLQTEGVVLGRLEKNPGIQAAAAVVVFGQNFVGAIFQTQEGVEIITHQVDDVNHSRGQLDGVYLARAFQHFVLGSSFVSFPSIFSNGCWAATIIGIPSRTMAIGRTNLSRMVLSSRGVLFLTSDNTPACRLTEMGFQQILRCVSRQSTIPGLRQTGK